MLKAAKVGGVTVPNFKKIAILIFQTISGDYREPRFIDFSPGAGVPHWVIHDQATAGSTVPST